MLAGRSDDCGGFALVTALVEHARVFTPWVPGILESIISPIVRAMECDRAISARGVFFWPISVASHFKELLVPLQRFRTGQDLGFDEKEMGPVCGLNWLLHAWIVVVSVEKKWAHARAGRAPARAAPTS